MKSYKIFIAVIIVLVIVNCFALTTFWAKQGNMPGRNGPPPAVKEYLTKELKLTPGQEKLYAGMSQQHFEYTRKLNEENRMLRDSFFENIKTPVLDIVATNRLEKKIIAIQEMLDMATLNHFRKFRTILDADQQDKFDHIIKNAMHMMGGPPQRGRGDRGGPGPNGPPDGMPPLPGNGPGQGPPPDGPPPGN